MNVSNIHYSDPDDVTYWRTVSLLDHLVVRQDREFLHAATFERIFEKGETDAAIFLYLVALPLCAERSIGEFLIKANSPLIFFFDQIVHNRATMGDKFMLMSFAQFDDIGNLIITDNTNTQTKKMIISSSQHDAVRHTLPPLRDEYAPRLLSPFGESFDDMFK